MHGSIANRREIRGYTLLILIFIALLFFTAGCQLAQSGFAQIAGNAGAEFSAAASTLSYVHEGKLTPIYAKASFADYHSKLSGIDQQLPSLQGTPDTHTLHNLLNLYKPAIQAVNAPCLSNSCDWQSQVNALQRASQAFLKAAGQ